MPAGRRAIVTILAALLAPAASAAPADFRCFRSAGAGRPILLQFDFPQGKRAVGHVSYQRGSGKIPVRLVSTQSEETAPGRPRAFTTTWKEVVQTGPQGSYTLVTQGARVYGFTFVRGKDRRRVEFEEDLDAAGERGCVWQND